MNQTDDDKAAVGGSSPLASSPPMYLPVDTIRGIEYAIIPIGMSEVYFDHMMRTLEFHAKHHPDFVIKESEENTERGEG